jgi:hypothetical protein
MELGNRSVVQRRPRLRDVLTRRKDVLRRGLRRLLQLAGACVPLAGACVPVTGRSSAERLTEVCGTLTCRALVSGCLITG